MRFASLALLALSLSACRLENPAFEDSDELADGTDRPEDSGEATGESKGEGGSGSGEGDPTTSESESGSSSEESSDSNESESSDSSSDESSSSSSEGESSSSSSEEESSSSSEEGPDPLTCEVVANPVDCYSCAKTHCCDNENLICFDPEDPSKCGCVLECLNDNSLLWCLGECGPTPIVTTLVSTMVELCTSLNCSQYCKD